MADKVKTVDKAIYERRTQANGLNVVYLLMIGTLQNMRALESVLVTVRGAYPCPG